MKMQKIGFERPIYDYLRHDYYQKIVSYIRKKDVLDVGCVEEDIRKANSQRPWNFWFVYKLAKNCVGIDIEKESIEAMKKAGFNAQVMDAEKISFKNRFDVVFGGEVIEHLPNPGNFLKACAQALRKGGKIILTTPNAFSANRLFRVFQFITNEPGGNIDHTLYLTPQTITTLVKKCGLSISKIDYAHYPYSGNGPLILLNKLVCKIIGDRFKEQMIVVINM